MYYVLYNILGGIDFYPEKDTTPTCIVLQNVQQISKGYWF